MERRGTRFGNVRNVVADGVSSQTGQGGKARRRRGGAYRPLARSLACRLSSCVQAGRCGECFPQSRGSSGREKPDAGRERGGALLFFIGSNEATQPDSEGQE
jgi:hypothetical protein